MKVFVSWAGEPSRSIGRVLHDWLPKSLQQVRVFHSDEDLQKGTTWAYGLAQQLAEIKYGLVVLTKDNQNSAWLNYEAGALSKTVADDPTTRVNALLIQMDPGDVVSPMKNFQNTVWGKRDFFKTFRELNQLCDSPLDERSVVDVFEKWWPELDKQVRHILARPREAHYVPKRPQAEVLEEILELTRSMARQTSFVGPRQLGLSNADLSEDVIFPVTTPGARVFDASQAFADTASALGVLADRCQVEIDSANRAIEIHGPKPADLPRPMKLKLRNVANRHGAVIIFG